MWCASLQNEFCSVAPGSDIVGQLLTKAVRQEFFRSTDAEYQHEWLYRFRSTRGWEHVPSNAGAPFRSSKGSCWRRLIHDLTDGLPIRARSLARQADINVGAVPAMAKPMARSDPTDTRKDRAGDDVINARRRATIKSLAAWGATRFWRNVQRRALRRRRYPA